jgi:hypothetical protein
MEKRPSWEANSSLAGQELPSILLNSVHYLFHKSPPLYPILSQMNPAHITPFSFVKIRFRIIFPFNQSLIQLVPGVFPGSKAAGAWSYPLAKVIYIYVFMDREIFTVLL